MSSSGASIAATKKKTQKKQIERALKKREPKVHENVKSALFLKGPKTSQIITDLLNDLWLLKKPNGVKFSRHNAVRPFEDETSFEFFSQKNDCSLFAYGSHSKKRPHNLVLGRFFDHHILDMVELGVENFKSMKSFHQVLILSFVLFLHISFHSRFPPLFLFRSSLSPSLPLSLLLSLSLSLFQFLFLYTILILYTILSQQSKYEAAMGSKPCFIFRGSDFEFKEEYRTLSNLLLDFFRGTVYDMVNLAGLDHVIICTAADNKVYFRHYSIVLKRTETKLPRVELVEVGPSMDFTVRRTKLASRDLMKQALKVPKEAKPTKEKNVSTNVYGKLIRVHKGRQDFGSIQTRKMKGLKRARAQSVSSTSGEGDAQTSQQQLSNNNTNALEQPKATKRVKV
ncbi:rRNA-binding ribosome biosynthesis protein rpf2 [Balamuthia mandrillaris]